MNLTTTLRWIGAIGASVAAAAHISLYRAGYSDIPIADIGTQFLLNAAGGVGISIGLIAPLVIRSLPAWTTRITATGGVAWAAISLLAYTLSHSDRGWMGYQDGPGFFMPAPEGAMSVVSETVVLIACAALMVTAGSSYHHTDPA